MIACKKCDTEYEDHASYCNVCDLPLVGEDGKNLEKEHQVKIIDAKEVLTKAKRTASSVHRVLGWIYFILLALSFFFLVIGKASEISDYAFLMILVLPATVHLIAAEGLVRDKSWARPLSIVVGIIILVGFPIGTICGVIILTQMFKKEWRVSYA